VKDEVKMVGAEGNGLLREIFLSFFCFILNAIGMGRDTGCSFGDEQTREGSTQKESDRNDTEG
jgi:hypothetical protein